MDAIKFFSRPYLSRVSNKPLFMSDELVRYKTVLRENFSTIVPSAPTGKHKVWDIKYAFAIPYIDDN
jgi:hypothetical protein